MDKNGGGLWLAVARRCNCSNWRTTINPDGLTRSAAQA